MRNNNGLGLAKGYFDDNVVPCCKICNAMKRDFDLDTFLNQAEKIYKFNFLP